MTTANNIVPGMIIIVDGKAFRVETSIKVSVPKGTPFMKTKLKELSSDKIIEKNFKLEQPIEEVSLEEHHLEYLYPETKDHLFLDVDNLEQILVSSKVLGEKINYLKEGVQVKAMFYGKTIFSVELPQFLELMIVKTDQVNKKVKVSNTVKKATLETGAMLDVPLFIEVGDIIKVDTLENEYIQRV